MPLNLKWCLADPKRDLSTCTLPVWKGRTLSLKLISLKRMMLHDVMWLWMTYSGLFLISYISWFFSWSELKFAFAACLLHFGARFFLYSLMTLNKAFFCCSKFSPGGARYYQSPLYISQTFTDIFNFEWKCCSGLEDPKWRVFSLLLEKRFSFSSPSSKPLVFEKRYPADPKCMLSNL